MRIPIAVVLLLAGPVRGAEVAPLPVYDVSWVEDGALIAAGTLATGLPYLFSARLIHTRCPCDPLEVNAFDRGVIGNANHTADVLSDATVALAVGLPLVLELADVGFNRQLVEDLVVYAEALTLSGAAVTAAKYIVQRPLPRTYAGDPALVGAAGGYRSFYSGHTSLAAVALTTASMTWVLRHGRTWWPWVVTAAVVASVAAERVLAGRHFYTDVILGAAAGTGFGLLVPYLHRHTATELAVVPTSEGALLSWGGRF